MVYKTNILRVSAHRTVYDNCSAGDKPVLDKAQPSAAKIVLGCFKTASSNDLLTDVNLNSLRLRREIPHLCSVISPD